uniref:PX domain-containing protein n=1 Tax=Monopterus albus TaxID=43700 RepID=A0A3Q3JU19_MONAL
MYIYSRSFLFSLKFRLLTSVNLLLLIVLFKLLFLLQEEVKEIAQMTFGVSCVCQLSGTGEYHVYRTYDDFEWLQQHLFSQEDVPGIQGVIVSTRYFICFLGLGEWQPYCKALETFLQEVASHSVLSKNKCVEIFLTSSDVSKLLTCFFYPLFIMMVPSKNRSFMLQRMHKIAVACGHFSAALHLCVEQGEDPDKQAFSKLCVKLSEVFDSMKKNMVSVAENNVSTLGLGLDLDSRYQEAQKEMLFRRTCKLVELETARRNAEKAKPVKKAMEEMKKTTETEFIHICGLAKQEVKHPC